MITSGQNAKVKLARALLGRSKERRQAGAFVAEGVRLVEAAVESGWKFRFAFYAETLGERGLHLVETLAGTGVDVEMLSPGLLHSLSETEASQGLLAVLELASLPLPPAPDFILIPDQIRDPGNLGALLRTAAAANVSAVLIPPETADPFAPKVVRAAMGAHFSLPIHEMDWPEIQALCASAGLKICLADMAGEPCWEADLRSPLALILGGEAEGASPPARALAAASISIPMPGGIESLNVAAAGAVLIFEVLRQQRSPN